MKNSLKPVAIVLVVAAVFVYSHEVTHYTVAEQAGCEASIHWMPDLGGELKSISSVKTVCPEEVETMHRFSQNQVEAVGYQLLPLYMMIALLAAEVLRGRQNREARQTTQSYNF